VLACPRCVHKFGGSSVADADAERVAAILEADAHPRLAVVLSACRGVTDALSDGCAAERQQSSVGPRLEALRERYALATTLLDRADASDTSAT
jgi:aspartokinase